jgi:hypothetical protein
MRLAAAAVLVASGAIATGAVAQVSDQTAGIVAVGAEGVGQGLGAGVTGGSSVFVTATGKAPVPASVADTYGASIEGKATTAVEAARLRDQRLDTARGIAQRFRVGVELGAASISHESPAPPHAPRPGASPPAPPSSPPAPAPDEITARTAVVFRVSDPRQLPAFLDALEAAGIQYSLPGKGGAMAAIMAAMSSSNGGGVDGAWDQAAQNAIAEARRQAGVLAAAAGRRLGEAQQILQLTRNTGASEASVTVAVRFGLTDK